MGVNREEVEHSRMKGVGREDTLRMGGSRAATTRVWGLLGLGRMKMRCTASYCIL